jgi:high-affinity K+ transport system ATPase subunit B
MSSRTRTIPLFDSALNREAAWQAVLKLSPRHMVRNPVMFVVEVGATFSTLLFVTAIRGHGEAPPGFVFAVCLGLWFTVLFANFAEAVAEGRGKAQAATLLKSKAGCHLAQGPEGNPRQVSRGAQARREVGAHPVREPEEERQRPRGGWGPHPL